MANELVHTTAGTSLTQAEFEAVGLHVCNSQATGDLIYASSATQLSRLAVGAVDTVLVSDGTNPSWDATPILNTAVAKGTWTASGTWTIPAVTLGGTVSGGSQVMNTLGHIGIKIASDTNIGVYISEEYTDAAAAVYGTYSLVTSKITADNANAFYGVYGVASHDADSTTTKNATGTPGYVGVYGQGGSESSAGATWTITDSRGIWGRNWAGTNATLTNSYGVYISGPGGSGTVTNNYGIFIEDMTKGGTLDIGIAIAGADTAALWVSSAVDTTDAANGIMFGISRDTNLYRSAANVLKTDDTFNAAAYQVAGAAGVSFGPAAVASITVVSGIITAIS